MADTLHAQLSSGYTQLRLNTWRAMSPSMVCVCLYISTGLKYNEICVDIPNVVVIYLLQLNLHVLSIYRPPSYSEHENLTLLNFLYDFCTGKELLILGDLNHQMGQ